MTDVSGWADPALSLPAPSLNPAPPYDGGTAGDQADAFGAALRDAGGDKVDERQGSDDARRTDRRDDEDRRKRRQGAGGEAPSIAGGAAGKGAAAAGARPPDAKGGKIDILGGLAQHPAAGALAASAEEPGGAEVDLSAFAAMLEQAAARADAVPSDQSLRVLFNDPATPLQSAQVSRAPDGSISLALAADPDAVPAVTRSLEALRRRLEARGFALGEVRMAEDAEPAAPRSSL